MQAQPTTLNLSAARFSLSAARLEDCPPSVAEVAVLGRSNAGKSSSINALCSQRSLARTSRTPGRTQLLNFFELSEQVYLVDTPGFGYARTSRALQKTWMRELRRYLQSRSALRALLLVSDIRQAPAPFDAECLAWAQTCALPCLWLLNKSDKLKQREKALKLKELSSSYPEQPALVFSAHSGFGLSAARERLQDLLQG